MTLHDKDKRGMVGSLLRLELMKPMGTAPFRLLWNSDGASLEVHKYCLYYKKNVESNTQFIAIKKKPFKKIDSC